MAEPVIPDPRGLLDTYAAEQWLSAGEMFPAEFFAPKTFAALRAVLTLIEEWRADGPDESSIHILMERIEQKIAADLSMP